MINPGISAVWSTTKPIAPFSCTPSVQEVHTKAEVVHLTPGLLGLGVLILEYLHFEYDQSNCTTLLYTKCTRSTYQS